MVNTNTSNTHYFSCFYKQLVTNSAILGYTCHGSTCERLVTTKSVPVKNGTVLGHENCLSDTEFYVHSDIFSPKFLFLATANTDNWTTGQVDLPEENPDTIAGTIHFLYTGSFVANLGPVWLPDDKVTLLRKCFRVYICADFFIIDSLRDVVAKKIILVFIWCHERFAHVWVEPSDYVIDFPSTEFRPPSTNVLLFAPPLFIVVIGW